MRVLMLVSDAHGGRGGIAQYNRDVIAALAGLPHVDAIRVLPRLVEAQSGALLPKVSYDLRAAGGRTMFVWRALAALLRGPRFDLIFCGHINLMPVAALLKRLAGGRLVLAVHGTDVWQPTASWLARRSLAGADMILSVSQFTIDRMAMWHGATQARARMVPNTVNFAQFGMAPRDEALAKQLGLAGKRVIMTLGRMAANERAKGFDEVIAAMPAMLRRRPDLVYLIAGEGDDRARLEAKAAGLGVSASVIFAGEVPESRKPDYYRLADAFVLASQGEGFGIVLLEALACGVPVLGSTADATQEALLAGALGPSVDPRDADALADAILAAIDRPKQVPEMLGHYGFDKFQSRLDAAIGAVMAG